MRKIFLVGDSIRMGYDSIVGEKLSGRAEVFYPGQNCEFAMYTLRHLHEWAENAGNREEISLVHWNNGLWDVLRQYGDEPLTPPDVYAGLLRRIYRRIGILFPAAKVIFALSTPLVEGMNKNPVFQRTNDDIRKYNAIAEGVMKDLNVEVNDLFSVAWEFPAELHSDWVHYTGEGYRLLADAVVKAVDPWLQ
jgi:acyl-CoA thioesterase-1